MELADCYRGKREQADAVRLKRGRSASTETPGPVLRRAMSQSQMASFVHKGDGKGDMYDGSEVSCCSS